MKPRVPRTVAIVVAAALCALVAAPASWASEPSAADSNGRAILVACPDGFGGATPATLPWGQPGDCDTLSQALAKAVDNGTPDDLILLRPGYYCPVNLPDTGSRLYLQGIPTSAWNSGGGVEATSRSEVEAVTFASYASETCATIYNNAIIRSAVWENLIFLSNLAVDGASSAAPDAEGHANYGIELGQQNSYVRDVVVKRASTGLKISGGTVSHSAFVQNQYVGVETSLGRGTWIADTLIADTVAPGAARGIGLLEGPLGGSSAYDPNDTLQNVTVTRNEVGLGRAPSTSNTHTSVRNSLIAGNDADCDYSYVGMNGLSGSNAVTDGCYGLQQTPNTVTMDPGQVAAMDAVNYSGGFEPYADPHWLSLPYYGDPSSCSLTDQLEQLRGQCVVGAYTPTAAAEPPGGTPVTDYVGFPATLDLTPVQPGETTTGQAWLQNIAGGFVTVSDVTVTTGFTVQHDDCTWSFIPRSWTGPGGEAAQPYCAITVSATPTAPQTGTLTVATNHGDVTIALSASIALPPVPSAIPTLPATVKVGAAVTATTGTWAAGTTFTYQWRVNGSDIDGATGASYTPAGSDRGKQLSVAVTGSADGYTSVTEVSAARVVGYGTLKTAVPTFSNTVRVGAALTAAPGAWTPGTAFTYQWLRSGKAISGATKAKYTPTATDRGKKLSVTVKGTLSGYTAASKTSAAKTVGYGKLATATPKITGTAKKGKTLKASPGTWKAGSKTPTLTYRWYANGKAISGATKKTFVLKSAQVGKKITVKVKGTSPGYTSVTKTSAATAKVKSR